jgi:NAD(P)-dependent dehydrogenase (short-subunit alcohol dehydrogenase family)
VEPSGDTPTPADGRNEVDHRAGALTGQRAVVVGGGSGIGFGSARVLARDGAIVTIAGRTEQKLVDAVATLAQEGLEVAYAVCDALDAASVRAAVDAASDDDRGLQIAVVVPGLGAIKPVLLFDDDDFSAQVDANVRPVYLFLKYAGQAMVRAGGGSFVAISSTAAVFSTRYLASYAAGKAAVDQLVRVAANELGELGIRVNSVQPGMTRTPGTAGAFRNAEMMAAFLAEQPIPRHGEVEDIAQAVRYFAGPESSWVTGQLLTVDGGNTLRSFIDYDTLIPLPDTRAVILGADSPEGEPS